MNVFTFPILRLLSDGQFHSGEVIARQFGVTRATVWNALQQAEALGVRFYSVRGRGYRLPEPLCFLEPARVKSALGDRGAQFLLEFHDSMPSTNTHLMQRAAEGAPHGTCVATELQTAGRGRRGRRWQAGLGSSLTFSVLWRFDRGAGTLSGLSLAVGLALLRALRALGLQDAGIKWPNDMLHRQRKLAGILIELQGDIDGPSAAVIGIGLNLRLPEAALQAIDQPAVDLSRLLQGGIDPSHTLGLILRHLAEVMETFDRHGFGALSEEWSAGHVYHRRPVTLLMPDAREIPGLVQGVTEEGALLVQTADGLQRFSSGEISLRGMNR